MSYPGDQNLEVATPIGGTAIVDANWIIDPDLNTGGAYLRTYQATNTNTCHHVTDRANPTAGARLGVADNSNTHHLQNLYLPAGEGVYATQAADNSATVDYL